MKTFVVACICFSLLVAFLFGSAALLSREALSLAQQANALGDAPKEQRESGAKALIERWGKERLLFIIFVHKEEVAPLENALTRAHAAAKAESDDDFTIAVAEVLSELEHLEWLVGMHFEGIV